MKKLIVIPMLLALGMCIAQNPYLNFYKDADSAMKVIVTDSTMWVLKINPKDSSYRIYQYEKSVKNTVKALLLALGTATRADNIIGEQQKLIHILAASPIDTVKARVTVDRINAMLREYFAPYNFNTLAPAPDSIPTIEKTGDE